MNSTAQQGTFHLNDTVQLIPASDGREGVVLQFNPMRALKLNAAAFELLNKCRKGYHPASSKPEASREGTLAFLDRLGMARILEWRPAAVYDKPFVSIVIAVYNRQHDLRDCLTSLQHLDYPPELYEIIVVDDASTDGSAAVARQFGVRLLVQSHNQGQSAARNRGVQQARGDIVAFIDSDCMARREWLAELVPCFQDSYYGLVAGRVEAFYDQTTLDRYEAVQSALDMGPETLIGAGANSVFYVPACNMLVRRTLFLEQGGFNPALRVGEDVDWCWRLMQAGERLLYVPAGRVQHKHRNRFWACFKRRFDYGTSEPLLYTRHPHTRRRLPWQAGGLLFLLICLLGLVLRAWPLAAAALLLLFAEAGLKLWQMRRHFRISLPLRQVLEGVLRSHLLLLYYLTAYLTRYFLGALLLLTLLLPTLLPVTLPVILLPAAVAWFQKKPRLNLPLFIAYFWIEQLFYQSGVLWGCIQHHNFRLYRLTFVHAGFLTPANPPGKRLKKALFRR